MYFRKSVQLSEFVDMLINGSALPTGSASPYRIKEDVIKELETAKDGLEGKLISVSHVISGGHWKSDTDSNSGYIGNFQCRVEIAQKTTFANLSVADICQFLGNADKKAVVVLDVTDNKKTPNKPYKNIRCKDSIVVDTASPETVKLLRSIIEFAKATADIQGG